jgi:GTP pyrophosphokinase
MHQIAEFGIAAHWKYKSGSTSKEEMDQKLAWIASLIETEEGARDPDEFFNALKTDIFHDEVFVFTPKGDVIALPNGANLIDFAYAVHSAVGNKMIGGKINGMIVPIDRTLQNGEIVEILTSSSTKGPSRDWVNIVKTSSARAKIRAWFKKEKRSDNIVVGRATVDAELKKICGRATVITDAQREEILQPICTRFGYNSIEDFYNAIGYGGLPISKFTVRLQDECERVIRPEVEDGPQIQTPDQIPVKPAPKNIRSNGGIVVDGESGCMVKFAKCCNPLPGDKVIGFVTKGFGISIHKTDCPNVLAGKSNPENADRWKEAHWETPSGSGDQQGIYEALLQIYSDDRIGMLADITVALADMRVSILQVNVLRRSDGTTIVNLKVGCKNIDHCNSIVSRLRGLNGVNNILRGFA